MIFKVVKAFTRQKTSSIFLRAYSSKLPKYESLAVSVPKPHVYHVEFNRAEKLNSMNEQMWIELKKCFEHLHEERDCRVVVVSARGKHFTAGIDLSSVTEFYEKGREFEDPSRNSRYLFKKIGHYQDVITSLEVCIKPVIVVAHSACVGAGVDFITAADIRFCTKDSWFQVKEVDLGLAADVGTLQRLPKVVGNTSIVRELCLTARKFDSSEAQQIGLVSQVLQDKDTAVTHALEVAESIASKSPVAVQTTKQNLVYSQNKTNQEGLDHVRLLNQLMLQSDDLSKSAVAAMTKEKAEFDDL